MANLTIVKANDKDFGVTITSRGSPIDITGSTVYFTVKVNRDDPDLSKVIQKKVTAHTDPVNGVTLIQLTRADTDIAAKQYWYDIKYISATNKVNSSPPAKFIVTENVTDTYTP